MIDSSTVDRIFAAANIVEVISDFITLKKKGVNYQACCPFHNEKTPSFVVSPAKGLFKCFGCGKGGNAVTFVMEHENMSYVEALKYVAKKYGIEVQERELSPEEVRKNDDRESMMIVNGYASDYFTEQLHNSDEGVTIGMSYLKERSISDAMIRKFRLGYCPAAGESFTQTALKNGYKEEFIVATGLTVKRDDGRLYDRFFGRVMFPIHSISGRVLGFGGRTLRSDKKVAKYLNSPESEVYHKSNTLYGLFFAKKAITQDDCCILVEGYTDVISMHQSGVENVVASSGTSLTIEQVRLIGRFTHNVTIIYDGDSAGIKASLRGIDIILKEGLNVRIVLLPEGEDPDTFAKSHSSSELKEYIQTNEQDFISFKTRILLDDAKGDPIKRSSVISDVVTSISVIPDNITRALYISDCSRMLEISDEILSGEVARKRIAHHSDSQTRDFIRNQEQIIQKEEAAATPSQPKPIITQLLTAGSSIDEIEKELVKLLLKYGSKNFEYKEGKHYIQLNVADVIINDLSTNGLEFKNPAYRALYHTYLSLYNQGNTPIELHNFVNHSDPNVSNAAVDILTLNENYRISDIWSRHDVVSTSEEDALSEIVPRTVILYKSKAIENIIGELFKALSSSDLPDEQQSDILRKIDALNKERNSIALRLNRTLL